MGSSDQHSGADRNPYGHLIFIKLGGSLVSEKTKTETLRHDVLARIVREIWEARSRAPKIKIVVGHGSGSFGHVPAAKHGTRFGVSGSAQWKGFCEVSNSALRLNRLVTTALLDSGVPAVSLQPSASAVCHGGTLVSLATGPIKAALDAGLVPVVHGDVAFDGELGGTVVSTEEIFSYLAREMAPRWLLFAGETEGVYDGDGAMVNEITPATLASVEDALGGSRGTDVTGGMASKVREMLLLVEDLPETRIRIFSGLNPGDVRRALCLAAEEGVVGADERSIGGTDNAVGNNSGNARNGCEQLGTVIKTDGSDGHVS